jgi:hypothetical protein
VREIPDVNDIIMDDLKMSAEVFPGEVGSGGKAPPVLYRNVSEYANVLQILTD